jgi:hypothetical protein
MSEGDAEESAPMMSVDSEIKQLLGLFDLPAFARRGQDLEYAQKHLHARCRKRRETLLEMVRVRLRQWSRSVTGPEAWSGVLTGPLDSLWSLSLAEEPVWALEPAPLRQQRNIARDLIASVRRFNGRWQEFIEKLDLEPTNQIIDQYNSYYVIEKECVLGSPRLAARHFTPVPRFSHASLLNDYPLLPVPELVHRSS